MLCPIPFGDFSYFLHIANPNALLQRGDFVLLFRDKLLADETFVAGFDDSLHDGRIIQLLRFVDFGATGTAAGVDVREVFVVLLDVLDDVALHDLHVVDVVEQAEIGRAEAAAKLSRVGKRSYRAGVTLLTRSSVHWAESRTAKSSS